MIKRLKKWFSGRRSRDKSARGPQPRRPAVRSAAPKVQPRPPTTERTPRPYTPETADKIEDGGPGKNVLIRNRYIREETGTHDILKIVDDSLLDSDDEGGADPYNSGQFDRSKSWNLRTRK